MIHRRSRIVQFTTLISSSLSSSPIVVPEYLIVFRGVGTCSRARERMDSLLFRWALGWILKRFVSQRSLSSYY